MRKLTCMRMSAKMTILFSVIAACMIAVNSVLATLSEIQNILLYEEDNLNAMASKIVAAFEQNITVMGYALDGLKQDNDFMAALNTIYTLGEDMETTSEYHQAQNTLSAALFHEPLNDYFYRINVLTMDGFYLSSRYETIGLLENYSDELRTVMLRLPYLNERNRGLSQKTLVRPHIDPWFVARPISIYTLMSPAVYHGKQQHDRMQRQKRRHLLRRQGALQLAGLRHLCRPAYRGFRVVHPLRHPPPCAGQSAGAVHR